MVSQSIGVGYRSEIGQLPEPITTDRLGILVPILRSGDMTVKDEIIEGHMRLAASAVTRWMPKHLYRAEDLLSASFLGLVQAVDWVPTRLRDNNITPYIYTTCTRFIGECVEDDQTIRIPRSSYRKNLKAEEDANFIPLVVHASHREDEDNPAYCGNYFEEVVAGTVDDYEFIFIELLDSLKLTERERMIIDLLMTGYNLEEVGKIINLTPERVGQIRKSVAERFRKVWGK